MDLNEALQHLKELMEKGKIHLIEEMAEPLRNIMKTSDGKVVEKTVDRKVKALLLAIRAAESDVIDMSDINEKLLQKMMSMDVEERNKYFLSLPREKAAGYKEIAMRVDELVDFYQIISGLSESEFNSKFNKLMIWLGGNPANILKDYIILEIRKFHELMYNEKNAKLPKIPDYWEKIRDIRHNKIAHPTKSDLESNEDVDRLYRAINEIGLDKIVEEFKKYSIECIKIINKLDD